MGKKKKSRAIAIANNSGSVDAEALESTEAPEGDSADDAMHAPPPIDAEANGPIRSGHVDGGVFALDDDDNDHQPPTRSKPKSRRQSRHPRSASQSSNTTKS
ncbi:hypothetical protein BCR33DRAFT_732438 [Rhizoclosmatium globosum]|uniref:Uncharacterized protein n=1 Tax=Rhizoclosmatium globosum TaxID=329046 RepID=A0A1Y2D2V3_9FUNG|nr:hypothetical protein BCR33DRAFT_732438 [Rhizoclosmatium globosum]|eukprot:ORY53580.1 hypothetical protein BCR33DRAFT_732438 [Rhizoclosmatium globosum]